MPPHVSFPVGLEIPVISPSEKKTQTENSQLLQN